MATPWDDPTAYTHNIGRSSELSGIIADLQQALTPENLRSAGNSTPMWARKGLAHTLPGAQALVQPTLYMNQQYTGTLQNQLRAAQHERVIAEAAAALHEPAIKSRPMTAMPSTGGKPPASSVGYGLSPARVGAVPMLLLELLTRSGDTNIGEEAALKKLHGDARNSVFDIKTSPLYDENFVNMLKLLKE